MRIKQSILICFGMALILMTIGTATAESIVINFDDLEDKEVLNNQYEGLLFTNTFVEEHIGNHEIASLPNTIRPTIIDVPMTIDFIAPVSRVGIWYVSVDGVFLEAYNSNGVLLDAEFMGPCTGNTDYIEVQSTGITQVVIYTPSGEYIHRYDNLEYDIEDVLEATVEIKPDKLNTENTKFITAYMELPSGYSVEDIDVSIVTLTNENLFDSPLSVVGHSKTGDNDKDGVPDLKMKFDISGFKSIPEGEYVCTVAGELADGQKFKGTDIITVVTKTKK